MRVAIDATPLTLTFGGLARYTSELSQALAAEFPEDEYILLSDQNFAMPPGRLIRAPGPSTALARRWWLWGAQREMRRQRAEIFHGTNFSVPYYPAGPSVLTLHDLSPWMDSRWHHTADRVRRVTPRLIRFGIPTMILTDSDAVRRQAIDFFHISPQRIAAVPLAASEHFRPGLAAPAAPPYFLFTGTLEPRKNLPFLVDAWRPVYDRFGAELVLAGRRREDFTGVSGHPGLRILGEISENDLPMLYAKALAFVYPSLYEGFGLPVIEAMQCGSCVITSTDPAIGEVAGDAAVRLDPRDARAWTEAMTACLLRADFAAARRELSLARSREFSWQKTAAKTREVYLEAMRRFHG